MEYNGKALADLADPKDPTKVLAKAGEQLAGFGLLRDDGTTASRLLDLSPALDAGGQPDGAARQRRSRGIGQRSNWAWAWPANRRILYNRASCRSRPASHGIAKRKPIAWNGKRWGGTDVPDIAARRRTRRTACGPFIMNAEGVARLFAPTGMAEGPLPEHYEPFEIAAGRTPCIRTTRGRPIRRRACSRATWKPSASRRTSRTWRPPIG